MSNGEFVRNLLTEQRRRLVGTLLGHIDRNIAPRLTAAEQKELREHTMRAVNAYHDVVLDIVKSSVSDGTVLNERALQLLVEMHARVVT